MMEAAMVQDMRPAKTSQAILVLGLLSALLLGPVAGVPGLILARTARPLAGAARVGYALCWYGCFVSYTAALLFYRSGIAADGLELVIVLACNLALLLVCLKWLQPPVSNVARALLIAIVGTLVAAPVITPFEVQIALPMPLMVIALLRGRVDVLTFAAVSVLPFLSFFPALLAIYWPREDLRNNSLETHSQDQRRWQLIFRLVVSYLVASVFLSWALTLNGWPWAKLLPMWPGLNFFWIPLMPVLTPVMTLVEIVNPQSPVSISSLLFRFVGLLISFLVPFFVAWVAISRQETRR